MFKRAVLSAFILAAGFISAQANAAFVATDWKSQGDSLATLDTDTGLEWLDLTQTGGKSINEVKSLLDSVYAGWRLPTYDEIKQLASTIFPVIESRLDVFSNATIGYFPEQMVTHSMFGQNAISHTYGVYEVNGGTYAFSSRQINDPSLWFNFYYSNNLDWRRQYEGVYLVSDGGTTLSSINNPNLNINNPNAPVNQVPDIPADVPVHVGFGLLGLALIAFGRRKSA